MKIEEVSSYNFSSSFANKTSFGSPLGLKNITLIYIKTKCGVSGIGEAYVGIYVPKLTSSIINEIKDFLIGKNPEELLKNNLHIPFVSRNGIFKSVYSAVDIALWDIVAKKKRKPLFRLLSNNTNNYKIYSSGGMVNSNLKVLKQNIETAKRLGHLAFKMRVGKQTWPKDKERINYALKLTKKLNLKLMVDSIMGTINPPWNIKKDFYKIKKIAKEIYWLEEPFHPDNYEDYLILTKKKIVKVATGEALSGELDYKTYLYNKLCNIIQIDVTSCGGITEAVKILNIAKKNKIKVSMHVWGSKVASLANTHFAYAFSDVEWLEYPLMQPKINEHLISNFQNSVHLKHQEKLRYYGLGLNCEIKKLKLKFKYIDGSKYKI